MGITFLYPTFLWALFLVAIPIIIHLFNFRKYKTVYFPNVSLLKEVQQESKKTRSVRNWLVLLLRILVIVFLVLTFSYPIEHSGGKSGRKVVSVYIDNSFSMDAIGLEGNKFDLSKSFADKIISEFEPNTKFQIITNDFLAKHQFLYSKDKALDLISEIPVSSRSKSIQSVLNRQLSVVSEPENVNASIYLISDFQGLEDSVLLNPDSVPVNMCLIASGDNKNIGLDSVWFDTPIRARFGMEEVQVKITNYSSEDFKGLPVHLEVNGKVTQQVVELKANMMETFSFVYQQPEDSLVKGKVFVDDANLVFDNELFFSYPLQTKTKVCLISDVKSFENTTDKLFKKDSTISYKRFQPLNIDYSILDQQNLIILGELKTVPNGLISELKKAADKGVNIAFFPDGKGRLVDYQKLAAVFGGFKIGSVDTSESQLESVLNTHSFFRNVFDKEDVSVNTKKSYPLLRQHFPISTSQAEPLIFKSDGSPYLIKSNNLYFCSSGISIENSGLKNHALIVPIFYQLVLNAVKSADIQYFSDSYINIKTPVLDDKATIEIKTTGQPTYKTQISAGGAEVVLPNNFQKNGHYVLEQNNIIVDAFGINNNRLESKEIDDQISNLKKLAAIDPSCSLYFASSGNVEDILDQSLNSRSYWKFLLIAAFVCLILEMLIIRILGR